MNFLKTSAVLSILFITSLVNGQQVLFPQNEPAPILTVYIDGQILGANQQAISLGSQNIRPQQVIATAFTDEKGKFKMAATIPFPDYYYLRLQNGQTMNLALFGKDSISVFANADNFSSNSNVLNSPVSVAINSFIREHNAFKIIEDSLKNVLQANPAKQDEVNNYFQTIAQPFYLYRNTFIQQWGSTPAIIATVNAIDQEKEWELFVQVVEALNLSFGASPTIQGIVKYKEQKVQEKEALAFLAPGKQAKEIALPNPNGDTLTLSALKGKVVLIDFWASWCRPCRAENPNVVKLYNKYNKDGFEVFSVSLDANKQAWENAIAADNLIWPYHVSDLKKWASAAAADYAVKGIPFTVLIDREGKIIATKLRGPALETQLKTIFGY